VDGSDPEGVGVVWLPSTAVGDGDPAVGVEGAPVAVALAVGAVGGGGDADWAAEADAAGVEAFAVVVGEVLCATAADELAGLEDGLLLVWLAGGRSAIDPVDDAAKTAAPSATRPRTATIGTSPRRLPRGRSVRQLGQKPETGVKL